MRLTAISSIVLPFAGQASIRRKVLVEENAILIFAVRSGEMVDFWHRSVPQRDVGSQEVEYSSESVDDLGDVMRCVDTNSPASIVSNFLRCKDWTNESARKSSGLSALSS